MKKVWNTTKLLSVGLAWWMAITAGVGTLYFLMCNATDRAQLHDPATMLELASSALQIAIGGVAGRLLWGARRDLQRVQPFKDEIPVAIQDDLSTGIGWAYFSGVATLVVGLVSFAAFESALVPVHGQSLLFVGMSIIFLAYGVSMKSRTCAILLMLAYLLGLPMKVTMYRESGTLMQTAGLALLQSALILWAYWRGIRGTFKYHQWLQLPRFAPTRPQAAEPYLTEDGFADTRVEVQDYGFKWGRPVR